jgi:hypothetical protein
VGKIKTVQNFTHNNISQRSILIFSFHVSQDLPTDILGERKMEDEGMVIQSKTLYRFLGFPCTLRAYLVVCISVTKKYGVVIINFLFFAVIECYVVIQL